MYRVQFVMKGNDSYYVANGYMEIKDQDRRSYKISPTTLFEAKVTNESLRTLG